MSHFRFLTAGESHGKALTAIIEGLPSGFEISPDFINEELKRRQQGYGRSSRQQLEADVVEITAGVKNGKTTGAPVCIVIYNKDFSEKPAFTKYRPGHADFAGSEKYLHSGDHHRACFHRDCLADFSCQVKHLSFFFFIFFNFLN